MQVTSRQLKQVHEWQICIQYKHRQPTQGLVNNRYVRLVINR